MQNIHNNLQRGLMLSLLLGLAAAATPASAADCEVKLGVTGPMSGGAAQWGLAAKSGVELAVANANHDGGLEIGGQKCQVKLVSFDALYTAAGGAAAANFFASQGIHAVVGPVGSPETMGFRPVAARNGILGFNPSFMNGAISPEFPLMFHAQMAPITFGPYVIKAAKERFNLKAVMIIGPNDQGGTDGGKQLAKMFTDIGIKPIEEYYQRGTTNFAPLAARVMNANPDAIDIGQVPPADAAVIVRQLLEAGYSAAIGALGGLGVEPMIQGAGGVENIKKAYYIETMALDSPGVVKMKQDYTALTGSAPPASTLFPVFELAAEQELRGIAAAGTDQDGDKIAAAMRKMTPESRYLGKLGWRGKTIYGINQELAYPVGFGAVIDGKAQPVQQVAIPSEE